MPSVSGSKISDNHTTIIEDAEPVVTFLHKDPRVRKILPGKINSQCGISGSGPVRMKIIDQDGCLLLAVSGSSSHQEIRVYLKNINATRGGVKKSLMQQADEWNFKIDTLDRRK
jgi:hypothetical protein